MSTTYITNAGEEAFLDLITAVNYTVRLFRNDVTSGLSATQIEALTASSFTEANFAGYSAAALTGGSWTTTQNDPSTATYATQSFARSSTGTSQTIYGFYVVTTSGGNLRWFEYFDTPIVVTNNGDTIQVVPRLTLEDGEDTDMSSRGIVAYQEETDNDSILTADGVTDLAISNVPVVAGRRYAIHLHSQYNMTAVDQVWNILFRVNASTVDRFARIDNQADAIGAAQAQSLTLDKTVYWSPSVTASTDDIDVYADNISGSSPSFQLQGTATAKRTFTVTDVGLA